MVLPAFSPFWCWWHLQCKRHTRTILDILKQASYKSRQTRQGGKEVQQIRFQAISSVQQSDAREKLACKVQPNTYGALKPFNESVQTLTLLEVCSVCSLQRLLVLPDTRRTLGDSGFHFKCSLCPAAHGRLQCSALLRVVSLTAIESRSSTHTAGGFWASVCRSVYSNKCFEQCGQKVWDRSIQFIPPGNWRFSRRLF
jgi:hypothetical protein